VRRFPFFGSSCSGVVELDDRSAIFHFLDAGCVVGRDASLSPSSRNTRLGSALQHRALADHRVPSAQVDALAGDYLADLGLTGGDRRAPSSTSAVGDRAKLIMVPSVP